MTHEEVAVLATIWRRWDADPKNKMRASAMVDVCVVIGDDIGRSSVEVRRRLQELRREGVSHHDAIVRAGQELSRK